MCCVAPTAPSTPASARRPAAVRCRTSAPAQRAGASRRWLPALPLVAVQEGAQEAAGTVPEAAEMPAEVAAVPLAAALVAARLEAARVAEAARPMPVKSMEARPPTPGSRMAASTAGLAAARAEAAAAVQAAEEREGAEVERPLSSSAASTRASPPAAVPSAVAATRPSRPAPVARAWREPQRPFVAEVSQTLRGPRIDWLARSVLKGSSDDASLLDSLLDHDIGEACRSLSHSDR